MYCLSNYVTQQLEYVLFSELEIQRYGPYYPQHCGLCQNMTQPTHAVSHETSTELKRLAVGKKQHNVAITKTKHVVPYKETCNMKQICHCMRHEGV